MERRSQSKGGPHRPTAVYILAEAVVVRLERCPQAGLDVGGHELGLGRRRSIVL